MSTAPQFAASVNSGVPSKLTAANTALDGTGATGRALIFTGTTNGSILPFIRFTHLGTNAATVARIFKNNGTDPEVASNNALIGEIAIAANTLSQTAESIVYDRTINVTLKNAERIYVTLGTAVAAGIMATPMGGGDL